MSEQRPFSPFFALRRRDFLKTFGITVGGLAITQLPFSSAEAATSGMNTVPKLSHLPTIGLLAPRSAMNPQFGANLAAGLKLSLDEADPQGRCDPEKLRIEEVGTNPADAVTKAKSLIVDERVDVLVAVINPNVAIDLHDALESSRTFLILADAGANIVRGTEQSPYIFHNTLGYWQSNWAMAEWGVRNLGKNVFVASSFYESGYDALYAFRLGAERVGGKILQTSISHLPPDPTDQMRMNRLMEVIRNAKPDFVFACYSGQDAIDFARAYSSSASARQIPLVASSFMADEILLDNYGAATLGMKSCLSWAPDVRTPENDSFKASFEDMNGRSADSFAVLGYDTGRMIIEAVSSCGGDLRNAPRAREAFRRVKFISPRGALRMDPETHNMITPVHLREVRLNGTSVVNHVLDELKPASESYRSISELHNEIRTGWQHAYLNV